MIHITQRITGVAFAAKNPGAGKIGSRPLGRAGLEGAPPRVTIKERCTTADDNKGRSNFGRSSDCG